MTKSDREKYEALMIDLRAVLRQHDASVWANGDEAELVLDIDGTDNYMFAEPPKLHGDSYPDLPQVANNRLLRFHEIFLARNKVRG